MNKKNIYTTDEKQPQGEQFDFYTNKFVGNFETRSTLDSKQQAKTLWEYDTQAMKNVY